MTATRARTVDAVLLAAGVVALVALAASWWRPGRPTLCVWSCGSNYESLTDFARGFEQRHHCRVRYTAAPVQYLLELALELTDKPDVIVGRGGPGWEALRQAGRLAEGPTFFAVDPYVIITAAGNPLGIRSLEDLGRDGVRIAYSPWAMRPRGKCPSHLMSMVDAEFFPGLCERWENNATVIEQCGRRLHLPVLDDRADAAIVPRCTTVWPEVRDRVEVVPIQPEHLLAMKQCRATIPQCCGVLTGAREPELARAFMQEMLSLEGREVFEAHGYLGAGSPQAAPYRPLMQVFRPKDMAGWQVHLAQRLSADEAYASALRRYLHVIHTFGPNHYEARARYHAGKCLAGLGRPALAREQWQRVAEDFPRRGKLEWESKVLHVGLPVDDVEKQPEQHWVDLARRQLESLPADAAIAPEHLEWTDLLSLPRVHVREGDPAKNGTRNFALAEDLLAAGHYAGATRDYLKVVTLNYPSRYMPEARLKVALCDYLRGWREGAREQWQRLQAESGHGVVGQLAARATARAQPRTAAEQPRLAVPMPPWTPAYDTWPERGMTYGMALWEHHLPLFTFKEMMKLLHGVYQKPGKLAPIARYRAGVCCLACDRPESAALQWRMCAAHYPETKWAKQAQRAIATLKAAPDFAEAVERAMARPLPPQTKPAKGSPGKRFGIAEELFHAELFEADQCLLEYLKVVSVTDPAQEKNRPFKPRAELRMAQVLKKTGRPEAARAHLKLIVEEYPESPRAEHARRMLAEEG